MSLISASGIHLVYQNVIRALNDVSFSIDQGEMVALFGPSGSGKSSLLALLAGFESPTAGTIHMAGKPLAQWPAHEYRTHFIGFLFQQFQLFEHLSAVNNVELALFTTCRDRQRRRTEAEGLLERVGLGHRLNMRVRQLSGGERQRVAFCRSIANSPRLLLADEPTGNLDGASKQGLLELMREHVDCHNGTLIVATHDRDVADCCSRYLQLRDGKLEGK